MFRSEVVIERQQVTGELCCWVFVFEPVRSTVRWQVKTQKFLFVNEDEKGLFLNVDRSAMWPDSFCKILPKILSIMQKTGH